MIKLEVNILDGCKTYLKEKNQYFGKDQNY